MESAALLRKIERLEQRLNDVEAENRRLRDIETQYEQLKETPKHYANVKSAKKPNFDLNYSSQRNEPPEQSKEKRKKKKSRNPAGRKPKTNKPDQAHTSISIYPDSINPRKCVFIREQFVWRLLEHKAQYVHYKIFDLPDSKIPPTIPGVRNANSEYGIEFLIMLAHHVYWTGLSIDKARKMMEFYTDIDIPKSQADKMLYQLANDWQSEYEDIAKRIAL